MQTKLDPIRVPSKARIGYCAYINRTHAKVASQEKSVFGIGVEGQAMQYAD